MFRTLAMSEDKKHLAWAFCCGEHCDCARYKQIRAGEPVPQGMLPTGFILERRTSRIDSM